MKDAAFSENASMIDKAMTLKLQAAKFMALKELFAEFEKAVTIADDKANHSFGEEHQRHVGAKIAYMEFIALVRRWAVYEVAEKKKGGNSYA